MSFRARMVAHERRHRLERAREMLEQIEDGRLTISGVDPESTKARLRDQIRRLEAGEVLPFVRRRRG